MRIIIGSVISAPPFSPGMALNWMQHAVGFERLGHEVHYVEQVAPDLCVDARGVPCPLAASENQRLFRDTMDRFGLLERACLIHGAGEATFGMSLDGLADACRGADLLINISGHVKAPLVLEGVRRRVYFDQDPVYTQLWRAEYGETWNFDEHDVFLTVGLNIGTPHTDIPDCDREWRYALPPSCPSCGPTSRRRPTAPSRRSHRGGATFTSCASGASGTEPRRRSSSGLLRWPGGCRRGSRSRSRSTRATTRACGC
jgi:hypothetical protein